MISLRKNSKRQFIHAWVVEVVGNVVALHTGRLREETEEGTKLKEQWKKYEGREV